MARKIPGWVWLLGAGAAAWYLWKNSASAMAAGAAQSLLPAPGSGAPALLTLPGSAAVTGAQVAQSLATWSSLSPANAIASGYINLPDGTQFAAATMTGGNTRTDQAGNTYVMWGGEVYRVGDMDAQGNWPATLIGAAT